MKKKRINKMGCFIYTTRIWNRLEEIFVERRLSYEGKENEDGSGIFLEKKSF